MLSISIASMGFRSPGLPAGGVGTTDPEPWTSSEIKDATGLRTLANKLNPVVGYWGERAS